MISPPPPSSSAGWNSSYLIPTVIKNSIVSCMNGVLTSDVTFVGFSENPATTLRRGLLASVSVTLNYTVAYRSATAGQVALINTFDTISNELMTAIHDGTFTQYMQTFAFETDTGPLLAASSNVADITHLETHVKTSSYPTGRPTTHAHASAAFALKTVIVSVSTIIAFISAAGVFYFYILYSNKSKNSAFDKWNEHVGSETKSASEEEAKTVIVVDSQANPLANKMQMQSNPLVDAMPKEDTGPATDGDERSMIRASSVKAFTLFGKTKVARPVVGAPVESQVGSLLKFKKTKSARLNAEAQAKVDAEALQAKEESDRQVREKARVQLEKEDEYKRKQQEETREKVAGEAARLKTLAFAKVAARRASIVANEDKTKSRGDILARYNMEWKEDS